MFIFIQPHAFIEKILPTRKFKSRNERYVEQATEALKHQKKNTLLSKTNK